MEWNFCPILTVFAHFLLPGADPGTRSSTFGIYASSSNECTHLQVLKLLIKKEPSTTFKTTEAHSKTTEAHSKTANPHAPQSVKSYIPCHPMKYLRFLNLGVLGITICCTCKCLDIRFEKKKVPYASRLLCMEFIPKALRLFG